MDVASSSASRTLRDRFPPSSRQWCSTTCSVVQGPFARGEWVRHWRTCGGKQYLRRKRQGLARVIGVGRFGCWSMRNGAPILAGPNIQRMSTLNEIEGRIPENQRAWRGGPRGQRGLSFHVAPCLRRRVNRCNKGSSRERRVGRITLTPISQIDFASPNFQQMRS